MGPDRGAGGVQDSGLVAALNARLLAEMPEYGAWAARLTAREGERRLLRALMNLRPPMPLEPEFLRLQDALLAAEREKKGIVRAEELTPVPGEPRLALWQGDITRLAADAIVNAANPTLLGCFIPCHGCIDNAIHSAAGLQLRAACARIMQAQGRDEPAGSAKLTPGFNLPARYVLHTVGPVISGAVRPEDRRALADCYASCLALAAERGLSTVAFCCISTGEYRFPNRAAAEIAVDTVTSFLAGQTSIQRVIFNVFKDTDRDVYRELLGGA